MLRLALSAGLLVVAFALAQGADIPSPSGQLVPSNILAAYEKHLDRLSSAKLAYTSDLFQAVNDGPSELVERHRKMLLFDRKRKRVRMTGEVDRVQQRKSLEQFERDVERLRRADPQVRVASPDLKMLSEDVSHSDTCWSVVADPDTRIAKHVIGQLKSQEGQWGALLSGTRASITLGYLPFSSSLGKAAYIPDLLRGGEVTVQYDKLQDITVILLVAKTSTRDIRLWLDPSLDFAARKIVAETRVREGFDGTDIDKCEYSTAGFQENKGYFYPTKFSLTTRQPGGESAVRAEILNRLGDSDRSGTKTGAALSPEAPLRLSVWNFEVNSLECNPELSASDFDLTTKIPDGTPVTMTDARHLRYVWKAGAAEVAVTDKRLPGDIKFVAKAPTRSRLVVLIVLNACALAAMVLFRLLRRQH